MKADILEKLSYIAKKESEIFLSNDVTQKDIYTKTGRFLIERRHIADMSIGIPTASICVRTHSIYSSFPAHTHDFIELMYVCSGKITHVIDGKTIELTEGDIIILGRATKHSILPTTEKDIGLNVIISTDYFESLLSNLRKSSSLPEKIFERLLSPDQMQYCVFKTAEIEPITNLMENLSYSLVTNKMTDTFIMQTSLSLLFAYIGSTPEMLSNFSNANTYTEKTKRKILNYIQTSYKTASLTEAADMLGLSPAHLSRWIKANFGVSFKEMLCDKRFEVAKELLLSTKLPINDIILNTGYENSSYFHKQFLKRFGTTPKNFRKMYSE
ncbi:MAG: helix-turn-helix domain-containing protein [Ruminococcaceae bacterium]|nr:helix-turn-helix domain-containing protein [Oscillospiraceae bacterium]